jgi:hypothetical protein
MSAILSESDQKWSTAVDNALKAKNIPVLVQLLQEKKGISNANEALLAVLLSIREPATVTQDQLKKAILGANKFAGLRDSCFVNWARQVGRLC